MSIRKIKLAAIIFLLIVTLLLWASPSVDPLDKEGDLPPKYQRWLDEVAYIITPIEREAFLKLESDQHRNLFIEKFWQVRDPTPGSRANEHKNEHYRRLAYANKFLGRDTSRAGWRTDRGRIYILLGEPQEIQRFPMGMNTVPIELWFYDAGGKPGLPPFFYLIFFKRGAAGEYVLYSPVSDGPESLVANYIPGINPRQSALKIISQMSRELAKATINLIPGEPKLGAEMSSQLLLGRIDDLPNRLVRPDYVEAFLLGKPQVEVEYTYKLINFSFMWGSFLQSGENNFLHYALEIEPQNVSLGQYEDKYYATMEISGDIKGENGEVVVPIKGNVEVNLTPEEFNRIKSSPFIYAGRHLLLPGDYTLNLLIKNKVSKEYGQITRRIAVPAPQISSIRFSHLVQAYAKEEISPSASGKEKPFQFPNYRIYPNVRGLYVQKTFLHLFFQLYLPTKVGSEELKELSLKYQITKGEEEVWAATEPVNLKPSEEVSALSFLKSIPLSNIAPGSYNLRIIALQRGDEKALSETLSFTISPEEQLPPPWLCALDLPPADSWVSNYEKARQLILKGLQEEAVVELYRTLEGNPDFIPARLELVPILIKENRPEEAIKILEPVVIKEPNNPLALKYLGVSHAIREEYRDAIRYYERLRHLGSPTPALLNALGEAYYKSGQREKAIEVLSESLKIEPNQPEVKSFLEKLKEGKIKPF